MKKTLMTIAAAGVIAAASLAPTPADASKKGRVAAGIIGGLAAGAIIAGAAGAYGPHYYGPVHGYRPVCEIRRQRVWDGYGWRIQRVRVCY